jgi:hypothetical protein
MKFELRNITSFQNWARRGYLEPLICHNDKNHPWLIADSESYEVTIRCVMCTFKKQLGLKEQRDILENIMMAEMVFENE